MKLQKLKENLQAIEMEGFLIPSWDCYFGEYVPPSNQRLKHTCGFSGSNGIAIITKTRNILFTDGRYLLQAEKESPDFEIYDLAKISIRKWCKQNLKQDDKIAFDPSLHSVKQVENFPDNFTASHNLVDEIWEDRPLSDDKSKIIDIPHNLAGKTSKEKILEIKKHIDERATHHLISLPENLCWLLNIRANDVPMTPLHNAFGLLNLKNDEVKIFNDPENAITSISNAVVTLDEEKTSFAFYDILRKNNKIIRINDPITKCKAIKNRQEIAAIEKAHLADAKALFKFGNWLNDHLGKNLTEIDLKNKLLDFRQENDAFMENSFDSIVGIDSNGAIIHYRVSEESNKSIKGANLLLLDSGGQYLCSKSGYLGTTDVTRMFPLSSSIPQKIKKYYSLVLKGHIRLASSVFPIGTTGGHLDALARLDLWKNHEDYAHGTGHGVGAFLSVHEGPQSISKSGFSTKLASGMIVSIEPGFYENDEFGIRIENLYLIEESENNFLKFSPLTWVEINTDLILWDLMSECEVNWINNYNEMVTEKLA